MSDINTTVPKKTAKDFASDQDVKWCPGCGDYAILSQVQKIFPDLDVKQENFVFISGIGCSSRFTYYMNTYGFHSIHGRAAAVASGVKATNPELDVWLISGDGDSISIGGNHFIHLLRRNFNIKYLLFNNQIYGLTKGQYSPLSEKGKNTKSTPYGSVDEPFNPLELALGAKATFVARSMDRDTKHQQVLYKRAHEHKGTAFVEIYQNCPVFNDEAFSPYTEKETKAEECIFVEHGKPMIFGKNNEKGIKLDGLKPVIVDISNGASANDLWIHDERDKTKAMILAGLFDDVSLQPHNPRPFGVFYVEDRPTYEDDLTAQINAVTAKKGKLPLDKILAGDKTWIIA
ncbi:MAG: 2-oxoacid:ferredoxin oxidoreductase subunit beta [Bacteroidetes bacterium]|nr:2-oxoacid:ferredoxin oxidoreductase subunit beta [Bacteroidota bacterium]